MADSYKSSRLVSSTQTPKGSQISKGSIKFYQKPRKIPDAGSNALFHLANKKTKIEANFFANKIASFAVSSENKRFNSSIDKDSIPIPLRTKDASNKKICEEHGKSDWVSQDFYQKSRFRNKPKRGDDLNYVNRLDRSGKRNKIREEKLISNESGLSVKSNLSFVAGHAGTDLGNPTRSRKEYFFERKMVHKIGSRKMATRQLEMCGFSSTEKDFRVNSEKEFYSNQKLVSKVFQTRKTKPISQGKHPAQKKLRNMIGIKTIENFGGMANFCLKKKKSMQNKFLTKKQSTLKTPNIKNLKKKYRDLEPDLTSSEEKVRGSSSVKARLPPQVWFPRKEKLYYSKKSHFFGQSEKSSTVGARERQVVQMFLESKQRVEAKLGRREESLMRKIQDKCRKIVQEPKSSVISRAKVSKLRKDRQGFEIKNIGKRPLESERSFQTPAITSIDPLFVQAFMVKKKRSKLKKGVSFFIAKFKSKRMEKSFYVYENEKKVIKFRRNQRNKIIEHSADDDYDTDDEQMKLAVRQCKKDFLVALKKAKSEVHKKKRAVSMINLAKKRRTGHLVGEQLLKLRRLHQKSKKSGFRNEGSASRRQTRKNQMGGFRKGESIRSLASTVASSIRSTHKSKPGEEHGRKMIRNEFYKADKIKRRAISILPKRSRQKSEFYGYFEKGCRKRNKIGF